MWADEGVRHGWHRKGLHMARLCDGSLRSQESVLDLLVPGPSHYGKPYCQRCISSMCE